MALAALPMPAALPRLIALIVLLAAVGAGTLWFSGAWPAWGQTIVDYDSDDDGLIEITTLDQIFALYFDFNGDGNPAGSAADITRYNNAFPDRDTATSTRMGCPSGTCGGYELMANLDFNSTTSTDFHPFWSIAGSDTNPFNTVLDGNGHTISNVTMANTSADNGFIGYLGGSGVIRNLGLINPTVNAPNGESAGGLVGRMENGSVISASYVQGGRIRANGNGSLAAGLAGITEDSTIRASYSTAQVDRRSGAPTVTLGGLVGDMTRGSLIASYAAGPVASPTGTGHAIGGLLGKIGGIGVTVTNSYCDRQATGQSNCIGAGTGTANPYTTAQLQNPTGYNGIYSNWNIDLDADGAVDYPWNFGTSSQYPTLNTPAQRLALASPIDYDTDDDGLIEIGSNAQLVAIGYDTDGDGLLLSNTSAYRAAFPGRYTIATTTMGCPGGACAGYELAADLTFAATSSWAPVDTYNATFDGGGHSITGININDADGNAGMFRHLGSNARIRDLGLINFNVTSTASGPTSHGILVGYLPNAISITGVYAQGGRISISTDAGGSNVGGLVGYCINCTLTASYSTAAVAITAGSNNNRHAGGLVGRCQGCRITAGYAAGPVTSTAAISNIGGLTGSVVNASSRLTDSYCDTEATGQPDCDGNAISSVTAAGYTTAQLQAPTGYTGIYEDWNLNFEGDARPDYPWNFGTAAQYPTLNSPARRAELRPLNDFDSNDNGLIDITSIAQLHAMRHDLNGNGDATHADYVAAFEDRNTTSSELMGCPGGTCTGYELMADLTFPSSTSSPYNPWTPIDEYAAVFDGAGHTLTGVSVSVGENAGVFGRLNSGGVIRDVGVVNPTVTRTGDSTTGAGGLVANVRSGAQVNSSYVSGGRVTIANNGGGAGGLAGINGGTIRASYANTRVHTDGSRNNINLGGLAGRNSGGSIIASYAIGQVAATGTNNNVGGLIGRSTGAAAAVTDSYCDNQTTGQTACIRIQTGASVSATATSTADLQRPTGYTGIYANWNIDTDGVTGADDPWYFGTSLEYPIPAWAEPTDYDTDDDGLIEIHTLAQLNVIRHDTNGNGDATNAAYVAVFPDRNTNPGGRMGCPLGVCAGYELMADITFPNPNTPNWGPINNYDTTLDGNGHTITGMNVNVSSLGGMFHQLNGSAVVRNLGLVNPTVRATAVTHLGGLAGDTAQGSLIAASYVTGGSLTLANGTMVAGGLVGEHAGTIIASHASTTLRNDSNTCQPVGSIYCNSNQAGGLVGRLRDGVIIASYALGSNQVGGAAVEPGGLVGRIQRDSRNPTIIDSYCSSDVTPVHNCIAKDGGLSPSSFINGSARLTAAELQAPTGYTGIYARWNIGTGAADDDTPDDPWYFGGDSDYPVPWYERPADAPTVDYDANDNGLIEIRDLAQLNAMRWDLDGDGAADTSTDVASYAGAFPRHSAATTTRMGCPSGACAGYELAADLSFPTSTDLAPYRPWAPLRNFATTLDGAGHTIAGVQVNITAAPTRDAALLGNLTASSTVRDLGLLDFSITNTGNAASNGILAGFVAAGATITNAWAEGGSITVSASGANGGGLVGRLQGGAVQASYSTAAVTGSGSPSSLYLGGLVGRGVGGEIIASYAAGRVSGGGSNATRGGLVGQAEGAGSVITNSYCDTAATGQSACVGATSSSAMVTAAGYGTSELQTPTDYAGIYRNWNIDQDADPFLDYPWNFGATNTYPMLNTPAQRQALAPTATDYDANNNNLIDIGSIAQLHALRWDADGDGDPDAGEGNAYGTAFPGRTATSTGRMGCPETCAGYELAGNLTFPTSTGRYNPWTPLPNLRATFDGAGHTLTGLTINTAGDAGLFEEVASSGVIQNVGLLNPAVTSTATDGAAGALAGSLNNGRIDRSYVSGGRVAGANIRVGGLVGTNSLGEIRASYANTTVDHFGTSTAHVGGLVGVLNNSTITAGYAYGPVAATGSNVTVGGLIGSAVGFSAEINSSYCNLAAGGQTACVGDRSGIPDDAPGLTAAELQAPTGYTGIYLEWNLDLDGDKLPDYPWNFGGSSDYPTFNTAAQSAAAVPAPADYDQNDNNLIDLSSIAQLYALRWDPDGDGDPRAADAGAYGTAFPGRTATATGRMGCPDACRGYELTGPLTFPAETSSDYNPWRPIEEWSGLLEGQGHTLTDLRIFTTRGDTGTFTGDTGLFATITRSGVVRDLGLINPAVTSTADNVDTGALVGYLNQGRVDRSYVSGGTVNAVGNRVGGLAGFIFGGQLRASYSTAAVNRTGTSTVDVGGLVGVMSNGAEIIASYAAGPVSATGTNIGGLAGLLGAAAGSGTVVTNSYSDTGATGQSRYAGSVTLGADTSTAAALTASALQTPTGYTGIYLLWNLDLDGDYNPDYPWNFGGSSDYPVLNTPAQSAQSAPPPMDYDADNNNLIEIRNIDQLNALRWDPDGDGNPLSNTSTYNNVFPGRTTTTTGRMGCPDTCQGYELAAPITFPASTSSPYNPWTPLPEYNAEFNGRGRALTGMNVNVTTNINGGLFAALGASSTVHDLGLINFSVTSTSANAQNNGLLAGLVRLGAVITGVYADGGAVTVSSAGSSGGGLVGELQGDLRAAWSTAAVTAAGSQTNLDVGGLVGLRNGGAITASYAAGPVTSTAAVTGIGGLVGQSDGSAGAITNSYCDTEAAMQTACIGDIVSGSASVAAAGYDTETLQTPTAYTTPYHNWNLDLDGDGVLDYPWNFGSVTQYPKLNTPAQRTGLTPAPMDYDQNNNNLIDISTVAQLDALRYDPDGDGDPDAENANAYGTIFAGRTATTTGRMGCPDTCRGYELTASLTFPTATTSAYNPWTPLPEFNAEFDGRGHTLTGINVAADNDVGLFGRLTASSTVRDLGLINVHVTSTIAGAVGAGTLAGFVRGAAITGVYADGGSVTASGHLAKAGGLVGELIGGTIRAAWSTAAVTATGARTNLVVGGLVGKRNGGTITAAYAAGPVTSTATLTGIGGLVGESASSTGAITDSYCDTEATTQPDCIGENTSDSVTTAAGHPTADLQRPTGYTGIYVQWNLDLDDNTVPDYPWNFGSSSQYPKLNTPTQREAAAPPPMDYDANNNNLIDIRTRAQLNAMRWDLDGDGDPETSPLAYSTAFPGRTATTTGRMGCQSACAGYELAASLTFPSGADLWDPIAGFNTEFNGQGRTITGVNINITGSGDAGLFGILNGSSTIRDLGLINVNVTSTGAANGILAGFVRAGAVITGVYADGGSVTVSSSQAKAGGLVGQLGGTLRAGYATAAVTATGSQTNLDVGGLVGLRHGGTITASYAAGPVTSAATLTSIGGLVGESASSTGAINHSYCDLAATTQPDCIGDNTDSSATTAAGYQTAVLQTPTTYTGIYIQWNLDLDANAAPDYPWNFGSASQYPKLNTPAQRIAAAPPPMDYDVNNNNLIDISNLDQLNAMRWDTDGDGDPETSPLAYSTAFPGRITASPGRMGCQTACAGYELTASLTFPTSTGAYNPWSPIGSLNTTLDGQAHTLTGANVSVSGNVHGGFIGILAGSGAVRDLGLLNFNVTSTADQGAGTLAGFVVAGANVTNVYAAEGSVTVSAANATGGGLVGQLDGAIRASYATAAVTAAGSQTALDIGGLVGQRNGGSIIASYAAGPVTSTATITGIGGLVGDSRGGGGAITNSYCDTIATTQSDCIGDEAGANAAPGYITDDLKAPTGYTGIYRNWNLNQDADPALDYPWNFGATTTYPILNTPAQRQALTPTTTNYDANGNNLIDITTIAQLNAIRWDPDGNGNPDPANANAYGTAFAGRTTGMGCDPACAGYELRANLTFAFDSPYRLWTPIPIFNTEFNGNGHTITLLVVSPASTPGADAGLFGRLSGANAVIKNVGLISPTVTATGAMLHLGTLAARVDGGASVETSFATGGSVAANSAGARIGGLVGTLDQSSIRASYAHIGVGHVFNEANLRLGGLVAHSENSEIIASYAAGALEPGTGGGSDAAAGGLVGASSGNNDRITDSYCDTEAAMLMYCIGTTINGSTATSTGYPTAELQQPTRYRGSIYETWNLDLDNNPDTDDDPWDFGSGEEYPALSHQRRTIPDSPPPGGPRFALPPQETPYNPAADHPEIYENDRHQITATCQVQRNADGVAESSIITIDLGNYRGQVILHLAQWNGEYFTSYESLGITMPTFDRNGQTATVRVTTDPTQTRFLLDSISPTTNLVLGYADCHTDDDTGVLVTPGATAAPETPAETATTSTPEMPTETSETAETSTPPTPKIYTNDRYEMTASCAVSHDAEGQPESSLITFDLGNYQGTVILSVSLWNGEYYASLESHGLTAPTLDRDGQAATVQVTTNPAETRFLLDGTPNGLRTNLLLGYADCHTAGE